MKIWCVRKNKNPSVEAKEFQDFPQLKLYFGNWNWSCFSVLHHLHTHVERAAPPPHPFFDCLFVIFSSSPSFDHLLSVGTLTLPFLLSVISGPLTIPQWPACLLYLLLKTCSHLTSFLKALALAAIAEQSLSLFLTLAKLSFSWSSLCKYNQYSIACPFIIVVSLCLFSCFVSCFRCTKFVSQDSLGAGTVLCMEVVMIIF